MIKQSSDYHDYVFRDGKLVAEFEDMYRYSEGVPWNQDKQSEWIDVRLTIDLLRDIGPFEEIHDLGCGLGYYLAAMHKQVGAKECRGFGYDISETACQKARLSYPEFDFQTIDMTIASEQTSLSANSRAENRRLFVIRGTLWYVFPKLSNVIKTIRSKMRQGDKLLVVQNFPPLDKPFIGKDVIPNHHALIEHFSGSFALMRSLWYEDAIKAANDNWFIGLFFLREPA